MDAGSSLERGHWVQETHGPAGWASDRQWDAALAAASFAGHAVDSCSARWAREILGDFAFGSQVPVGDADHVAAA